MITISVRNSLQHSMLKFGHFDHFIGVIIVPTGRNVQVIHCSSTVEHAYNDHVGTKEFDRFIRVTALTVRH